jgi:hypothetical protein
MTDENMSLRDLLEKTADTDFLREMIGFTAHRLMELDVESLTGAPHGARAPDRLTHRRYHDVPGGPLVASFGRQQWNRYRLQT